jgi:hypothetical protein
MSLDQDVCIRGGPFRPLHHDPQWCIVLLGQDRDQWQVLVGTIFEFCEGCEMSSVVEQLIASQEGLRSMGFCLCCRRTAIIRMSCCL